MNKELYDMIFKRKSFHLFRNIGNEHITEEELKDIEEEFYKLRPLVDDINVKIKIVKDKTTCNRGQEYCILFYSERKDNYLQNIGYLGEQLDLLENINCRAMMGEYLLYYNNALFGGIYDNRLLVKIVNSNKKYNMKEQIPYENAKAMYLVEDVDNKERLKEIVIETCKGSNSYVYG